MIRWIVANKLPYDSYLVRYWYAPICNRLFFCWSILFACAQFISSLFFGANFVFYAYCEESLRYTLLYHAILSRYHCLDYPTSIVLLWFRSIIRSHDTFEFPYFHWILDCYFVTKIVLTYCEKKLLYWSKKNFWNSRLEAKNLQNFWDH